MEIIVFMNKDGNIGANSDDSDFRTIEILGSDESNLSEIIKHALSNGKPSEKVHVLTENEYGLLKEDAKNWKKLLEWKKAKKIYEKGKKEFE